MRMMEEVSGLSGLCRANVGIVGILFHQDIFNSPALRAPFQENTSRAKIIEIPQSSPINHTGKFPVRFIRDYTLFPHIPHGLNLPVRKSQCKESLIRVEIFGECDAEPVRVSGKFRLGNPVIPAEGNHTACTRAPLLQKFPVIKDLGEQSISWQ